MQITIRTLIALSRRDNEMRMLLKNVLLASSCVCLSLPLVATGQTISADSTTCGSLAKAPGGYGPFDYRVSKDKLPLLVGYHFDRGVETLTKQKTGFFGGDIDYTLRAFPNHHRALMAMINLGLKEKTQKPRGANYTVDCYLMRAEQYQPDDGMVKAIFGIYFLKHGRPNEAKGKLEEARSLASQDANVHYNLGLAYYQLKDHERALEAAHRAYALGFPLSGLRDMLKRAGKWQERDPQQNQATSTEGKEPQQKQ